MTQSSYIVPMRDNKFETMEDAGRPITPPPRSKRRLTRHVAYQSVSSKPSDTSLTHKHTLSEPIEALRLEFTTESGRCVAVALPADSSPPNANISYPDARVSVTRSHDWELRFLENFDDGGSIDTTSNPSIRAAGRIYSFGSVQSEETLGTSKQSQGSRSSQILEIKKAQPKDMLKAVIVEPELGNVEPISALQIQRIDTPPTLHVVSAIPMEDIIEDPVSPIHDSDSYSDGENDDAVSEISDFIIFDDVPQIQLEKQDPPARPRDEPHFQSPVPSLQETTTSSSPISPISPASYHNCDLPKYTPINSFGHPDPLRSNPTAIMPAVAYLAHKRKISTSSGMSIHSNRSNRTAFVMQNSIIAHGGANSSRVSLHSQGTVTDVSSSIHQPWLDVPQSTLISRSQSPSLNSTPSSSPSPSQRNHSFRGRRLSSMLQLKRMNAVRRSSPSPATLAPPTALTNTDSCQPRTRSMDSRTNTHRNTSMHSVLSPVSETFDKLSLSRRKPSLQASPLVDHRRRSSVFSIGSSRTDGYEQQQKQQEKAKKSRGFHGAMVGHSRRGGL